MIDTHTHLNFKAFQDDKYTAIKRALEATVEKIIVVGTNIESSQEAVAIAKAQAACFATIGIHPHHSSQFALLGKKKAREQLLTQASGKKIVAIGETGLDYHHYRNYPPIGSVDKKLQEELLFLHLEIAKIVNLPVIFHCREAMVDMLTFLIPAFKRLNYQPKGVFHCFAGTEADLTKVLQMGFYIGFDGNISYQEEAELRKVVKATPLDRLLLETDAPYLTPQPYRGKRNEPINLVLVAQWIARIKNVSLLEVKKTTADNAYKLFSKLTRDKT